MGAPEARGFFALEYHMLWFVLDLLHDAGRVPLVSKSHPLALRQAQRPAAQAHPELLAAVRAGPPDTSQRLRHAAETFERASALVRDACLLVLRLEAPWWQPERTGIHAQKGGSLAYGPPNALHWGASAGIGEADM